MEVFAEDPTYLVIGLVVLAAACFVAMRVTQQGKFLVWALGSLGLAGLMLLVDFLWVTDNERIERVVYDLRRAVLAGDADGVLADLTPDVEYLQHETSISGEATRALIKANLANASFDFVHLRDLQVSAGRQTRRGKAEFRVYAKGTLKTLGGSYNVGTANSTWSLGFQQTAPGVWKVNRITPVAVPDGAIQAPGPDLKTRARQPGVMPEFSKRLHGRRVLGPMGPGPHGAPAEDRPKSESREGGAEDRPKSESREWGPEKPSRPGEAPTAD
ncbi:hypothetical protein OJF2_77640 [Aquisphaera giovannonii]|uniref:DUF4440 domain-containing protein n=1 Tax=Aquisphaera giovannonii TaxID=406548 RepID=A0A5B9WEZ3_9BACT|nr:hypothetical protein [Aquisphaera giovannonii]QEH39152.1 hypothetical protein OJF2_77640 [Aquisphaera giovannonii]